MTNAPRHLQSTYKLEQTRANYWYAHAENVTVRGLLGRGTTPDEAPARINSFNPCLSE